MRTQVGIVGAGPAGLLLSHLLAREGIDSVVIESRSWRHVENRIRAGVLEQGTVDLLKAVGLGDRMQSEGMAHDGIEIRFASQRHRIDFPALAGGRRILVYGQHEVVRDLIAARLGAGGAILFDATEAAVSGADGPHPQLSFRAQGLRQSVDCDFIAGCDGFHGVCRQSIPRGAIQAVQHTLPFAWLGILSQSPPPTSEVTYVHHDRGFALLSMRSPSMARLYLQCAPDEDIGRWPDDRIWRELRERSALAESNSGILEGEIVQRGITAMRSFVAEPMQYGRLFLAGDAAHIVPPTGAKGMNLAVADVRCLAAGLALYYRNGDKALLDAYSSRCLKRVWQVQRFSLWFTNLLHTRADESPLERRLRLAELEYVTSSDDGRRMVAENYVGLPFEPAEMN